MQSQYAVYFNIIIYLSVKSNFNLFIFSSSMKFVTGHMRYTLRRRSWFFSWWLFAACFLLTSLYILSWHWHSQILVAVESLIVSIIFPITQIMFLLYTVCGFIHWILLRLHVLMLLSVIRYIFKIYKFESFS